MKMIEKVARAVAAAEGRADWRASLPAAISAVTAMAEPTPDMLEAALPKCLDWGYLPEEWSAMIAKVLDESREPVQ